MARIMLIMLLWIVLMVPAAVLLELWERKIKGL